VVKTFIIGFIATVTYYQRMEAEYMVYTLSDLEIALTTDPNDSKKGTLDLKTRQDQPSSGYGVRVSLIEEPLGQLYDGVLKIIYKGTIPPSKGSYMKPMPAKKGIPFEISLHDTRKIIGDDGLVFKANSTYLVEVLNNEVDSFERDVYNLIVTDDGVRLQAAVTLD